MAIAGRIAWWAAVGALLAVALPAAAFIPLPYEVKPVSALLAAVACVAAMAARPRDALMVARERAGIWLAAFVGVAAVATLIGVLSGLAPLKGAQPMAAAIKAWASLLMGIGVWMALRLVLRTERDRDLAERWVWAGLAVSVACCLIQAGAQAGLVWCDAAQRWIASHVGAGLAMLDPDKVPGRYWGLSPEPSWLASQLCVVGLVPALVRCCLPASDAGWSRLGWAALAVCAVGLGLTRSLTGLGLTLALFPLAGILGWFWSGQTRRWRLATVAGLGACMAVMLILASTNPYLRSRTAGLSAGSTAQRAAAGGMASRVGAWQAGVTTAVDHPILGVGLGLAPWGVVQHLRPWALQDNLETQAWVSPAPGPLPNIKHLWIRLAAETGLLGLGCFCGFLLVLCWPRSGDSRALRLHAILAGVAVVGDGFSLDSFALPTLWVALALVAARRAAERDACASS